MRILVVENDVRLAEVIRRGLTETGHVVDVEHDGEAGESTALPTSQRGRAAAATARSR